MSSGGERMAQSAGAEAALTHLRALDVVVQVVPGVWIRLMVLSRALALVWRGNSTEWGAQTRCQGLITPMPRVERPAAYCQLPISPCWDRPLVSLGFSASKYNGGDHGQKPGLPRQRAWSWRSFRVWILRPCTVMSTSFCLSEVSLENDTTGYLGGLWSQWD